jgi:hypothetical protein
MCQHLLNFSLLLKMVQQATIFRNEKKLTPFLIPASETEVRAKRSREKQEGYKKDPARILKAEGSVLKSNNVLAHSFEITK